MLESIRHWTLVAASFALTTACSQGVAPTSGSTTVLVGGGGGGTPPATYADAVMIPGSAVISSSGGTDDAGRAVAPFALAINPDGNAVALVDQTDTPVHLPADQARGLTDEVTADFPLSQLNSGACNQPSAGLSDLYVGPATGGPTSPDLSCPSDDRSRQMRADALAILALPGVAAVLSPARPSPAPSAAGGARR